MWIVRLTEHSDVCLNAFGRSDAPPYITRGPSRLLNFRHRREFMARPAGRSCEPNHTRGPSQPCHVVVGSFAGLCERAPPSKAGTRSVVEGGGGGESVANDKKNYNSHHNCGAATAHVTLKYIHSLLNHFTIDQSVHQAPNHIAKVSFVANALSRPNHIWVASTPLSMMLGMKRCQETDL